MTPSRRKTKAAAAVSPLIPEATVPLIAPQKSKGPLATIENTLREEVIGQDQAVGSIVRALARAATGFRNKERPIATMFFSGPTGVGKTETARALAKAIHRDPKAWLKIDCSEFGESHTVSRLIGSPPGYVGSDLPVMLEKEVVEGREWNVIVFDEIEKAHPSLHNMLLQIMDEGTITLTRRTKNNDPRVSFTSTILIMTSNVGSRSVYKLLDDSQIGFKKHSGDWAEGIGQKIEHAVKKEMSELFSPEFRNRISDFVVFHPLGDEALHHVLEKILKQVSERFVGAGFAVTLTPKAKDLLIREGTSPELGARPLIHAVENHLEARIAELYAMGEIQAGDYIVADFDRMDKLVFRRAERVSITVQSDFSLIGQPKKEPVIPQ